MSALTPTEVLLESVQSSTMRTRGGERSVTAGPYAESVEQLGGFYLIETPDLETLLDLAQSLPPYDLQFSPVGLA